jgi:hypothetical protein
MLQRWGGEKYLKTLTFQRIQQFSSRQIRQILLASSNLVRLSSD